jgi:hypothetical protein
VHDPQARRRFFNSREEVSVTGRSQEDKEIREALRALLSDIESMYEGAETFAAGRQPEEFFGPFSVWKLREADIDAHSSISWPNLAISVRNAKSALRNADAESPSDLG